MADPDPKDPLCVIHQIVPRSLHDLVAKLRQETARADILGEGGNPILVIGLVLTLVPRDGALAAVLSVRFLVEGQADALWSASALHGRVKDTPAEAVLNLTLRMLADGLLPLIGWTPPAALGLSAGRHATMTVLGSLSVLVQDAAETSQHCAICLQEGRTEMESLELPLRAASDFRRFHALSAGFPRTAGELDFSCLEKVEAVEP